jgi:uncharacterized protein YidB (DUF937 family)
MRSGAMRSIHYKQTGISMNDLLAGLSQHLPDLVDQLTPKGRLPTEGEAARMV